MFSSDSHGRARPTPTDQIRGALLGLAVCDALGAATEFRARGSFALVEDMIGGGVLGLKAGEWTDDTSMALCLCESLLAKGFDPLDQLERYVRWWRHGHLGSNGTCVDIGNATRDALSQFLRTGEPWCGSEDSRSAGNGSLMRLAPVPIYFLSNPRAAIERSGESSRTTHGARQAVDACRFFGALLVGALSGASKEELLSPRYAPLPGYWDEHPLEPAIDGIACGSYRTKSIDEIQSSGYVVHTLEAALWAFHASANFRDGALAAINLGDDADTVGAVYGQLAGAFHGAADIPESWIAKLARLDRIERFSARLHDRVAPPGTLLQEQGDDR